MVVGNNYMEGVSSARIANKCRDKPNTHTHGISFIIYYKAFMLLFFLIQIVNNPIVLPKDLNPRLKNLIEGLLSKGKQHSVLPDKFIALRGRL